MTPESVGSVSDRFRSPRIEHLLAAMLAAILAIGGYGWWRERQRMLVADQMFQDTMGHGTEIHGPDPTVYLFYTFISASVIVGLYLVTRWRKEPVSNRDRDASPLSLLPDDEKQVLEPILESPGVTQVELRGRSGFSKSKVSQVLNELEERGVLYREPQGRTYRVYPGKLLKQFIESDLENS